MSIVHARIPVSSYNDFITTTNGRIETDFVPLTSEGTKVIISGVVLIVLTALWTWMRLWSLRQAGRAFAVDDGFYLGAMVLFYSLIASNFVMVFAGGLGHHVSELQDWHVVRLMQTVFARQFLYAATLGLVKISVILMFMRIVLVGRYKFAAMAAMVFSIAWVCLTVLIELLMCRPIEMSWYIQMPGASCGDHKAAVAAVGIIDIINQLAILMLPLPVILKLEMQTRCKIITACIFSIGLLTLVFGTIRLCTVMQTNLDDISYTLVDTTVYGATEIGISIIVSSCPLLRPIVERLLPGSQGWMEEGSSGDEAKMVSSQRQRKGTKSSGFTQMKNESQEADLELGNMGAHRAKRNTAVTVGRRPPSCDDDDDCSVHRIVVTSETIVSRHKGEL